MGRTARLVFDNQEFYGGTAENPAYARHQHLEEITVADGARVGRGDPIGESGDTYGYPAHLHFNLYIPNDPNKHVGYDGNVNENLTGNEAGTVDPRRYIDFSVYPTYY